MIKTFTSMLAFAALSFLLGCGGHIGPVGGHIF
jgi:predicted small lipoprotein YifL